MMNAGGRVVTIAALIFTDKLANRASATKYNGVGVTVLRGGDRNILSMGRWQHRTDRHCQQSHGHAEQ